MRLIFILFTSSRQWFFICFCSLIDKLFFALFFYRMIPCFGFRFAGLSDLNLSLIVLLGLLLPWLIVFPFSNIFVFAFGACEQLVFCFRLHEVYLHEVNFLNLV